MILSHKIEIKPNSTCKELLNQYFGYSRYCYNKGLDIWNNEYKNGNKATCRTVRDILKSNKQDWEKNLSPQVLDTSIEDLERGFKMFFKKINNAKHPKFKSKKKSKDTCRFYRKSDSSIRIRDGKLFLPKFPCGMKLTENIRFNGTIKTCTISKKADKYFASFTIDTSVQLNQIQKNTSCGIDLGVKELAIIGYGNNNNRKFKHIKGNYKKLKPLYEQISFYQKQLSRKKKDSKKYNVVKAKLQRLYLKINNIQRDYLNKLTTKICKNFRLITIETLKVSNMVKNHKLSEKISKSLWYTFRLMLEYKSKLYGNTIVKAPSNYPSTQTCSYCGYIRTKDEKLKLSDRVYVCTSCGVICDRDENASYNLKMYGMCEVVLQPI